MSRPALLLLVLVALGCSGLDEGAGGVVGLEIRRPELLTIEVGEMLPLSARALNKDGDSVAAEITWRAPDATLTVDPLTGVITAETRRSSCPRRLTATPPAEWPASPMRARSSSLQRGFSLDTK